MASNRSNRRIHFVTAVTIPLVIGGFFLMTRPHEEAPPGGTSPERPRDQALSKVSADGRTRADLHRDVVAFCGACHAYPDPSLFPRERWPDEVRRGYDFFYASNLDIEPPPLHRVVAHYQAAAPGRLERLAAAPGIEAGSSPAKFRFRAVGQPGPVAGRLSALAHVGVITPSKDAEAGPLRLLACDMTHGTILAAEVVDESLTWTVLAEEIGHPAHVEATDLDDDGITDYLVADLGTPLPSDARRGRVLWLRGRGDGAHDVHVLLSGVGRVADARPADIDEDGDIDIVVAVFGWHETGKVLFMENIDGDPDSSGFRLQVLDERPGAIHVPIVDLDGDGRLDVVALISQEHEEVIAYMNRGPGRFEPTVLFQAGHPAFGSSGIEVVDLDGDGDLDVLLSNGDVYDAPLLKPYHGVSWLENRGQYPFERRAVGSMYGAQRARAGDLDGDGDLDIIASSFLAEPMYGSDRRDHAAAALVLFEQTAPGHFEPLTLESVTCDYPSFAMGDHDGDGDLDLVVGSFRDFRFAPTGSVLRPDERAEAVWIWTNDTPQGAAIARSDTSEGDR